MQAEPFLKHVQHLLDQCVQSHSIEQKKIKTKIELNPRDTIFNYDNQNKSYEKTPFINIQQIYTGSITHISTPNSYKSMRKNISQNRTAMSKLCDLHDTKQVVYRIRSQLLQFYEILDLLKMKDQISKYNEKLKIYYNYFETYKNFYIVMTSLKSADTAEDRSAKFYRLKQRNLKLFEKVTQLKRKLNVLGNDLSIQSNICDVRCQYINSQNLIKQKLSIIYHLKQHLLRVLKNKQHKQNLDKRLIQQKLQVTQLKQETQNNLQNIVKVKILTKCIQEYKVQILKYKTFKTHRFLMRHCGKFNQKLMQINQRFLIQQKMSRHVHYMTVLDQPTHYRYEGTVLNTSKQIQQLKYTVKYQKLFARISRRTYFLQRLLFRIQKLKKRNLLRLQRLRQYQIKLQQYAQVKQQYSAIRLKVMANTIKDIKQNRLTVAKRQIESKKRYCACLHINNKLLRQFYGKQVKLQNLNFILELKQIMVDAPQYYNKGAITIRMKLLVKKLKLRICSLHNKVDEFYLALKNVPQLNMKAKIYTVLKRVEHQQFVLTSGQSAKTKQLYHIQHQNFDEQRYNILQYKLQAHKVQMLSNTKRLLQLQLLRKEFIANRQQIIHHRALHCTLMLLTIHKSQLRNQNAQFNDFKLTVQLHRDKALLLQRLYKKFKRLVCFCIWVQIQGHLKMKPFIRRIDNIKETLEWNDLKNDFIFNKRRQFKVLSLRAKICGLKKQVVQQKINTCKVDNNLSQIQVYEKNKNLRTHYQKMKTSLQLYNGCQLQKQRNQNKLNVNKTKYAVIIHQQSMNKIKLNILKLSHLRKQKLQHELQMKKLNTKLQKVIQLQTYSFSVNLKLQLAIDAKLQKQLVKADQTFHFKKKSTDNNSKQQNNNSLQQILQPNLEEYIKCIQNQKGTQEESNLRLIIKNTEQILKSKQFQHDTKFIKTEQDLNEYIRWKTQKTDLLTSVVFKILLLGAEVQYVRGKVLPKVTLGNCYILE
ncbi:Hypothetical_protein [Hexamita inflata]|uniref:Hypothetical_protein n=1 Tax=Hexamita inflata TaxID=28002 RepID=A0AA86PHQ1_9EUKA|nr:Hypothetical protein HINF_LOCUS25058 [Hexamita inflata]